MVEISNLKKYKQSPLPFQGQKRNLVGRFKEEISKFDDSFVFVDLFGGSGLLSHSVKRIFPNARVVYNDFDNFRERLVNIPKTNEILEELRGLRLKSSDKEVIKGEDRERVLEVLERWDKRGYVDWITLSAALLFSSNYCKSFAEFRKENFYNRIRVSNYELAEDYLSGIEVMSDDFRVVFGKYKDIGKVMFLADPPYLSTDTASYSKMDYWKLSDYLDILYMFEGYSFFYFTSSKSQIEELAQWLGRMFGRNPFEGCNMACSNNSTQRGKGYRDVMYSKMKCK